MGNSCLCCHNERRRVESRRRNYSALVARKPRAAGEVLAFATAMSAGRGRAFKINVAVFQLNDLKLRSACSQRNFTRVAFYRRVEKWRNMRNAACNRSDHTTRLVAPSTFRRNDGHVPAWNSREQLNKISGESALLPYCGLCSARARARATCPSSSASACSGRRPCLRGNPRSYRP